MNNKTEEAKEYLSTKGYIEKSGIVEEWLTEFSNQQNKELIEELETERKLGLKLNSDYTDLNTRLSAELSQQKELVDRLSKEINECLKQKDHEIFTLNQEIEVLKKENEEADELCKKILNGKGTICFSQLNRTIESQSLRIKQLEEGFRQIIAEDDASKKTSFEDAFIWIVSIATNLLSTPTTEEEKVLYTKSATVNSGDSINEEIFISKEAKEDKCKCEKWQGINLSGNCYTCQKPI